MQSLNSPILNSISDLATNVPPRFAEPCAEASNVGGYVLGECLGRGGMGEVWKAWSELESRHVVIKVLPPELSRVPEELDRVRTTFQQIHDLQHEHICPLYQFGDQPGVGPYLVMKYLDGITLSSYHRRQSKADGSFPMKELNRVLTPVADALDYAHSRRVIHRDIKPDNIMLRADGSDVQIVDFGLATEIRTTMTRVSRVHMDTSGTYPYMAPEQWKGRTQDARTDQYALAVVAYELLAGRLPFEAPDDFILRQCVLNDDAEPIEGVADHVNQAIAKAMSKEKTDRFVSCAEFIKSLAALERSPKIEAKPESLRLRQDTNERLSHERSSQQGKERKAKQRKDKKARKDRTATQKPAVPQKQKSTAANRSPHQSTARKAKPRTAQPTNVPRSTPISKQQTSTNPSLEVGLIVFAIMLFLGYTLYAMWAENENEGNATPSPAAFNSTAEEHSPSTGDLPPLHPPHPDSSFDEEERNEREDLSAHARADATRREDERRRDGYRSSRNGLDQSYATGNGRIDARGFSVGQAIVFEPLEREDNPYTFPVTRGRFEFDLPFGEYRVYFPNLLVFGEVDSDPNDIRVNLKERDLNILINLAPSEVKAFTEQDHDPDTSLENPSWTDEENNEPYVNDDGIIVGERATEGFDDDSGLDDSPRFIDGPQLSNGR